MRAGSAWAAILEVLGVYVAGQLVMFGLGTVVGIELAFGYIYTRTRSLIPSVVAHVLVNIPATLPVQLATLAAMGVVVWLARHQISAGAWVGFGRPRPGGWFRVWRWAARYSPSSISEPVT